MVTSVDEMYAKNPAINRSDAVIYSLQAPPHCTEPVHDIIFSLIYYNDYGSARNISQPTIIWPQAEYVNPKVFLREGVKWLWITKYLRYTRTTSRHVLNQDSLDLESTCYLVILQAQSNTVSSHDYGNALLGCVYHITECQT